MRAPALHVAALVASFACADQPSPDAALGADSASADSVAVLSDSTPAPRPFVPRDSIVFAFQVSEHEHVYFEPLIAGGDGVGAVMMEQGTPEADEFERRHYAPGTRYYATSGGAPAGQLELDGAALAGCMGIPGDAAFVDKVPAASMRGLAFSAAPPAARFVVAATEAEDRIARDSAIALLRGLDVPEQKLSEVTWRPVDVVAHPDGSRTILTTAEIRAFDDAELPAMAFVMLEATPTGARMVQTRSGDGRLIEASRSEFFDAADLDGDGAPEIVLLNHYFESWDYTILRRVAGRWEQVFKGSGSGC